jgi:hypothetical protein
MTKKEGTRGLELEPHAVDEAGAELFVFDRISGIVAVAARALVGQVEAVASTAALKLDGAVP